MKTYNIKLKIEGEEKDFWINLLKETLFVYNDMSKIVFEKNIPLNLMDFHSNTYKIMREKYPNIPSQAIIKIYKDLLSNYRTVKCNKHKKSIIERKNPVLRLDKRLYNKLTPQSINIQSPRKNKRITIHFKLYDKFVEMTEKYVMLDPSIFLRGNDLYLSVVFKTPESPLKDESVLGIDLGIRRIVTTSDGFSIKGNKLNDSKRRIRYNKRILQSKKSNSAKKKLKKIKNKERNINKNYIHHICNEILKTDKSIIVLEDLTKIKQNTSKTKEGFKRKKHNNMISQLPFFMIKEILSYKAPLLGKKVVTVSPQYTSQINSLSGIIDGTRKGCRYYAPNLILDADWNSSINIAKRFSKHSNSFKSPLDGALNFLDRLSSTDQSDFFKSKLLTL